jgi:hypothetical protein
MSLPRANYRNNEPHDPEIVREVIDYIGRAEELLRSLRHDRPLGVGDRCHLLDGSPEARPGIRREPRVTLRKSGNSGKVGNRVLPMLRSPCVPHDVTS